MFSKPDLEAVRDELLGQVRRDAPHDSGRPDQSDPKTLVYKPEQWSALDESTKARVLSTTKVYLQDGERYYRLTLEHDAAVTAPDGSPVRTDGWTLDKFQRNLADERGFDFSSAELDEDRRRYLDERRAQLIEEEHDQRAAQRSRADSAGVPDKFAAAVVDENAFNGQRARR